MNRKRLRGIKPDPPEAVLEQIPQWNTGEDCPITFESDEVRRLQKKTIYENYKRGSISKEEKDKLMGALGRRINS